MDRPITSNETVIKNLPTEGGPGCWEMRTQTSAEQRVGSGNREKSHTSRLCPAAQVGLEAEATAKIPGRIRGWQQWGCARRATLTQLWKCHCLSRSLSQGLPTRRHPKTYYWRLLPFREMRSSSAELRTGTSPPNQEAITGHSSIPMHWGQTPRLRRTGTLRTFFFLLNHSFYSPYILWTLHWLFVELWIFPFFF